MKKYDLIVIGTGSAMNLVEPLLEQIAEPRIAVIDKDPPGGICLTKGCIPTKLLVYPADLVRTIESASAFGIQASVGDIDFGRIMAEMRQSIGEDIAGIRSALSTTEEIDHYPATAEFTAPYTLRVGGEKITGKRIILCTGSRPHIPAIPGLAETGFLTSDTVLELTERPKRLVIIGGGYIAAEYAHFFSAMGTKVTLVGRNPRLLPEEEPEIGAAVARSLARFMEVRIGEAAVAVKAADGEKRIRVRELVTGEVREIAADEILVATGRSSNADLLHPERAGVETDEAGWIVTDERLETAQPGIWALGDANGRHMFKHVANYESQILYYNAFQGRDLKVDYHAVPHAVFTWPEVAAVGMTQAQAEAAVGPDKVLVGFQRYIDTARGMAMRAEGAFVKLILEDDSFRILGTHIVGPEASILIQEVINLMYTPEGVIFPLSSGMHIHPALSEVVERAALALYPAAEYDAAVKPGLLGRMA